jgi:hypothetical protein
MLAYVPMPPKENEMTLNRIAAAALAALGAAIAIPIPLAQLDFAGMINVFDIESGGSRRVLIVLAAVGGVLTFAVLATALAGAVLAATGARRARTVLLTAAVAGFVTAMPIRLPAGVVIGAAALLTERPSNSQVPDCRFGSSSFSAT